MKWSRSKLHIGASTAISCLSLLLTCVSFATNHWIEASPVKNEGTTDEATINVYFGLFGGWISAVDDNIPSKYETNLKLACHMSKCMYSCAATEDERDEDIACYQEHEVCTIGDMVADCANLETRSQLNIKAIKHNYADLGTPTMHPLEETTMNPAVRQRQFVNFVPWCVIIFFLVWSVIMALLGVLLGLLNTCSNPSSTILAAYGLYVWNSGAAVCLLLVLSTWASMYHGDFSENIGIRETLDVDNFQTAGLKHGYSFLVLIGSLLLHLCNLPILYTRNSDIIHGEFRQKQEIQPPTEQHIVADNLLY